MKSRPDNMGAPPVGAPPWLQAGIMEIGKSKIIKGKAHMLTQSIHVVRGVNLVIMGFTSWAAVTEPGAPLPSRNTCGVCGSFVNSAQARVVTARNCTRAKLAIGLKGGATLLAVIIQVKELLLQAVNHALNCQTQSE